jgi:HSP20 family protein
MQTPALVARELRSVNLDRHERVTASFELLKKEACHECVSRSASRALTSWIGRDLVRALQDELDQVLSRMSESWTGEAVAVPSVDLSETDSEVQLMVDVPGMKPEEIDIEVTARTLRIRGEHKEEKEETGRTFHRIERRGGSIFRSVELPCAVKEDRVAAEYKNGVLKVTLPKSEEAKSHKIKIKATGK